MGVKPGWLLRQTRTDYIFLKEKYLERFMGQRQIQMEHGELKQITKTEIGSPCNENGEYTNCQKNNRMDAI
jgi:hypothetical protein